MAVKKGPLTRQELMDAWRSVTDEEYHKPLLEKEGSNVEVIEQAAEQLAQVSGAIDRNVQAMYILPWSGQTAPPASGPGYARTNLTLTRTKLFDLPVQFLPGEILVQHRLNDYGPEGPVDVTTNRLFVVEQATTLGVGEAGPVQVPVVAVKPGPGYNHVLPDELKTILQPGVNFANDGATVLNGSSSVNRVIADESSDVPIDNHIGQYLLFTAGSNAGKYRLILGYEPAEPDVHGGIFNLAVEVVLTVTSVTGTFTYGENITQPVSGAVGKFISLYQGRMVILRTKGVFTASDPLVAELGGTATVTGKEQGETLTQESFTAAWRVVDFKQDLGLEITNEEQPTGGVAAFLDELGNERGLPRTSGEDDEEYRMRISKPGDVVSPNALRRTANRILEQFGAELCLREVGYPNFRGVFFDGSPSQLPFAFDLDLVDMTVVDSTGFIPHERVYTISSEGAITRGTAHFSYPYSSSSPVQVFRGVNRVEGVGFQPGQTLIGEKSGHSTTISTVSGGLLPLYRFFMALSLREFRGFFLAGVPPVGYLGTGTFFDTTLDTCMFDTTTQVNIFDSEPTPSDNRYQSVYDALKKVKAGGVLFDLYIEREGCV